MSGPFARFGGLVGCTLLDVCGRLRALDIYIYIHLPIDVLIEQIVVVMAGDDGDEQRTEQNRKGPAAWITGLRSIRSAVNI